MTLGVALGLFFVLFLMWWQGGWIRDHREQVSLLATLTLIGVTVVYVVETGSIADANSKMANEMRKQAAQKRENAKTSRRPHIVVRAGALVGPELHDDGLIQYEYPREVIITALNCGDRVAVNVVASVFGQTRIDSDDPLAILSSLSHFIDRGPGSLLMPGEEGTFKLFLEKPPQDGGFRDVPQWIIDEVGYPDELFLAVWYRGGGGDKYVTLVDLERNADVMGMLQERRHLFFNVPDKWEFPGE